MMRDSFEAQKLYYELEQAFEWRKWAREIPAIRFPSHWKVRIIPPFAAAMVRFSVTTDERENQRDISVYLDCYEMLGFWDGQPYWEIYPSADGDTWRYAMNDIDGLIAGIEESLKGKSDE